MTAVRSPEVGVMKKILLSAIALAALAGAPCDRGRSFQAGLQGRAATTAGSTSAGPVATSAATSVAYGSIGNLRISDQNRGEAHDQLQPPAMPAARRRLQQSDRSQQSDLFDGITPMRMPTWGDLRRRRGYADRPDGTADPGARSDQQTGLTDGGRS